MRSRTLVSTACLLALLSGRALADPIQPPVTDAFGWADGETRRFSLTWNGQTSSFSVDQVGAATYHSLDQCCADMFSRILELNPGGSLLFTGLALNTMPVNTTFVDGLNLDLLRAESANIASLTGYMTLQLPPDVRRGKAVFDFTPLVFQDQPLAVAADAAGVRHATEQVTAVPEPGTLALVGAGLLGVARLARKRRARQ